MQKKQFLILCAVGLFFSCSDYILPKRMEVKGTVNIPARIGMTDLSTEFMDILQDAFSSDGQTGAGNQTEVFNVEYKGQSVLTFCVYNPIEMTENLNPNAFLKTISTQINNGISSEPRKIDPIRMPVLPGGIPIADIHLPDIPPVSLASIATYVTEIDFKRCDDVLTGIGLNFKLDTVVDGLKMVVTCDELKFSSEPKLLQPGNNIFGNSEDFKLYLAGYENGSKKLTFTMQLQAEDGADKLIIPGYSAYEIVTIMEGSVEFFQNWTEATIDMEEAIKKDAKNEDNFIGTFPKASGSNGFNMSGLKKYLDGDFTFDGLETNLYMNNPVNFNMRLTLEPQYEGKESEGPLFDDNFSVEDDSFVLSDHLEDGIYPNKHLPGIDDNYVNESINDEVIVNIFHNMPESMFFEYKISFTDKYLRVIPDMFNDSGEQSTINMALMIMMPLRLIATNDNCVVLLPGMFGESNDLFGRDEGEKFSDSFTINNVKMTLDFFAPIFSGGRLFIDGDRENDPLLFYPNGIRLSAKNMIVNFNNSQMAIVEENLIKPNIWIRLNKDNTITVPIKMGVVRVNIEMKAVAKIEDVFE